MSDKIKEKEISIEKKNIFHRFSFKNDTQSSIMIDFELPHNGNIVYDNVVDDSQFRPDSEQVRAFQLTGSGSSGNPQYDDNPDAVTDLEVQIRSGKLDKAEISQLMQKKEKDLKESTDNLKSEKLKKEIEKENKARQDYLDKATGFKGNQDLAQS